MRNNHLPCDFVVYSPVFELVGKISDSVYKITHLKKLWQSSILCFDFSQNHPHQNRVFYYRWCGVFTQFPHCLLLTLLNKSINNIKFGIN